MFAHYTLTMALRLYAATTNQGKLRDFRTAAEAHSVEINPLPGLEKIPAPEENGATFAANAGLADYREYIWKAYKRFDYTPQLCLQFADAIAETCVPVVKKLDAQRAKDLGVRPLRPWDLSVDPKNRQPLEPFKEDQTTLLIDKTKEIFQKLSPELADDFESLRRNFRRQAFRGRGRPRHTCVGKARTTAA